MAFRNTWQESAFALCKSQELRQRRALQLLERNVLLKQVLRCEPGFGEVIRELTALLTTPNRDRVYSRFKQKCERFVGWGASHKEVCTSEHYVAVMTFIHTLISWIEERPPEGEEEAEDDQEELITTAVRQSLAASREASLQLFKNLAGAQ
ncbi:hypothetical protein [Thermogemmatispora sp.]|uniref:hypothetical protein n=1 Tax=Thermogemmatispora sp. TaxID=1968838 RepID=UPI0035E41686